MAIRERLLALKLHIAVSVIAAGVFSVFLHSGPSLSALLSFFWPLLLSTAVFLLAVSVLLRISPPQQPDAAGCPAGEDLIDYVAGTHYQQLAAEAASTEESEVEKLR
ncbi:hypothetical protein KSP40_PGU020895 [Platanthera guangdongensis]|uniref:Uncharacterized protein n=1 Tax=Platanthera guangdongensis TaxID=2320717 RepID=A0ABR2N0V1_9ASPA